MIGACGIVLAAGAGTRYGMPKALARTPEGTPWVRRAVETLEAAGCAPVLVVLGARADEARPLVPPTARIVLAGGWAGGLSATLRAALGAATETDASAAVVVPVDAPGLEASVVQRVLGAAPPTSGVLARAVYHGAPGHPVLLGRDHWEPLGLDATGDRGAADYLVAHGARLIECGDLWDGADVDRPHSGVGGAAASAGTF